MVEGTGAANTCRRMNGMATAGARNEPYPLRQPRTHPRLKTPDPYGLLPCECEAGQSPTSTAEPIGGTAVPNITYKRVSTAVASSERKEPVVKLITTQIFRSTSFGRTLSSVSLLVAGAERDPLLGAELGRVSCVMEPRVAWMYHRPL